MKITVYSNSNHVSRKLDIRSGSSLSDNFSAIADLATDGNRPEYASDEPADIRDFIFELDSIIMDALPAYMQIAVCGAPLEDEARITVGFPLEEAPRRAAPDSAEPAHIIVKDLFSDSRVLPIVPGQTLGQLLHTRWDIDPDDIAKIELGQVTVRDEALIGTIYTGIPTPGMVLHTTGIFNDDEDDAASEEETTEPAETPAPLAAARINQQAETVVQRAAEQADGQPGMVTVILSGGLQSVQVPVINGVTTASEALSRDIVRAQYPKNIRTLDELLVIVNDVQLENNNVPLHAGDVVMLAEKIVHDKGL